MASFRPTLIPAPVRDAADRLAAARVSPEAVEEGVDAFFDTCVNAIEAGRTATKEAVGHRLASAGAVLHTVEDLNARGKGQVQHVTATARGAVDKARGAARSR